MATYSTTDLQKGKLYRCALSGHVVLVVRVVPCKGWYYNPVTGTHEETALQDGQLQPVESPWPIN